MFDQGCLSDTRLWSVEQWNGISFFYNDVSETSASIEFFTDAAPSGSFGSLEACPKEMPSYCKSTTLWLFYCETLNGLTDRLPRGTLINLQLIAF